MCVLTEHEPSPVAFPCYSVAWHGSGDVYLCRGRVHQGIAYYHEFVENIPSIDMPGRSAPRQPYSTLQELSGIDSCKPGDDDMLHLRGGLEEEEDPDLQEHADDAEAYFQALGLPNLLADEEEEADEAGGAATKEAWPLELLQKPLYPGCQYTVQQFCYALFRVKTGSIRDDRADLLCKLMAQVMPEGYLGPKYVHHA